MRGCGAIARTNCGELPGADCLRRQGQHPLRIFCIRHSTLHCFVDVKITLTNEEAHFIINLRWNSNGSLDKGRWLLHS